MMASQAGDRPIRRRVLHICPTLLKLACHFTMYVETVLFCLRCHLHKNKHLNFTVVIPSIQFEFTAINLTVFSIGVGLLVLCLLSLLSLVQIIVTLGIERVKKFVLRPRDTQLRLRWLVCILCLLPFSTMYSVWLFFFVREKWTSTFAEPVKILYLIPTCVFILHTVAEVFTLFCAYALTDGHYSRREREGVIAHVRMVELVNYTLIIYCISILYVVYCDDLTASTAFVKVATILFEFLFRVVFLVFAYHLKHKIESIHNGVEAPPPGEEIAQSQGEGTPSLVTFNSVSLVTVTSLSQVQLPPRDENPQPQEIDQGDTKAFNPPYKPDCPHSLVS